MYFCLFFLRIINIISCRGHSALLSCWLSHFYFENFQGQRTIVVVALNFCLSLKSLSHTCCMLCMFSFINPQQVISPCLFVTKPTTFKTSASLLHSLWLDSVPVHPSLSSSWQCASVVSGIVLRFSSANFMFWLWQIVPWQMILLNKTPVTKGYEFVCVHVLL